MDRAEGALLVAEKALESIRELAQVVEALNSAPADHDELIASIGSEVAKAVEKIQKPKDGESVSFEQVECMVADAVAKAMLAVRTPKDGEPGRDALDIQILSEIDESKSYKHGLFAIHNGGMWHSFEQTNGMRGWECSQNGIAELGFTQDDEDPRVITVFAKLSNGKVVESRMHIPAVIDKGVYCEGQQYRKADGVTWGRHFWIANNDTKNKPEPNGGDWRLAVKSGRDGASAYDIARRGGFAGSEADWIKSLQGSSIGREGKS